MYRQTIILLFSLMLFFNGLASSNIKEKPPLTTKAVASVTATFTPSNDSGKTAKFIIRITNPVSAPITFILNFGGNAMSGLDYKPLPHTATILPSTTFVEIPVILFPNTSKNNKTLELTISNSNHSDAIIGTPYNASITNLKAAAPNFTLKPKEASFFMVNPNATPETIALFYNLKTIAQTGFIVGQQDAFTHFHKKTNGEADIKSTTGHDPGLSGLDFMFITDDQNIAKDGNWFYNQEKEIIKNAQNGYNKGIVNMFSWHFREPFEGQYFFAKQMSRYQRQNALISILPGGINHDYYKQKLQKIAQITKGLIGDDGKRVPIIFRPFHEFDSDWFWWGRNYCTPEQYKALFRFTVKYLRDDMAVNNMLFAFSPDNRFKSEEDYLERYPGDEYVDILGLDDYKNFNKNRPSGSKKANKKLQIISKLAKERVKVAALTETGHPIEQGKNRSKSNLYTKLFYDAMTKRNIEIAFMMFWSNTKKTYYTPPIDTSEADDFINFTRQKNVLLLNKMPDMYTLPSW